uniref:Putative secreted protein n=1 Tax=Ixodes ricinus TaxID=34613 RepID=A0A6B0UYY1_IXORI
MPRQGTLAAQLLVLHVVADHLLEAVQEGGDGQPVDHAPFGQDDAPQERELEQGLEAGLGKLLPQLARRLSVDGRAACGRVDGALVQQGHDLQHKVLGHVAGLRQDALPNQLDHLAVQHFVALLVFQALRRGWIARRKQELLECCGKLRPHILEVYLIVVGDGQANPENG